MRRFQSEPIVKRTAVDSSRLRLGGGASDRTSLEAKLTRYQDTRRQLEDMQDRCLEKSDAARFDARGTAEPKSELQTQPAGDKTVPGTPGAPTWRQCKPGITNENNMYGLEEHELVKARQALQVLPESRTQDQIVDLVKWTLDLEIFYGLTMEQRNKICAKAEARHGTPGKPVLRVGDQSTSILLIMDGQCCIYIDCVWIFRCCYTQSVA